MDQSIAAYSRRRTIALWLVAEDSLWLVDNQG
jgi:hypothetical protein